MHNQTQTQQNSYVQSSQGDLSTDMMYCHVYHNKNAREKASSMNYTVILLQSLVMVSPGTHLSKNHKSQSRQPMSASLKKKTSPKWKILGPLCSYLQTVI